MINEFCAKNNNIITDSDFNQFSDWIEIINTSSQSINLNGYYLSDDPDNITKWKIPPSTDLSPEQPLVIWADDQDVKQQNLHTNFKLSSDNGWIGISGTDSLLIHEVEYGEQFADISCGLQSNDWVYFAEPTPGMENITNGFPSSQRENQPVFSLPDGFYESGAMLEINDPSGQGEIHFTLDGSIPNLTSPIYSQPIELNENKVVRARIFGSLLPGQEATGSYFIGISKDLPIISLIINPDFLWSDSIGIFNDSLINLRKDWERYSIIQYFENYELAFKAENDIRLFGNTAIALPQKSIAIFPSNKIQYPIFRDNAVQEFESLILRSSSDDWNLTMLRDGFIQTLVKEKLPLDYQGYQPAVMYINGEYFGIFNVREKYNEDYIKHHHGIDKDELDLLELNYWDLEVGVLSGTDETYFNMLDFLYNNDITNNSVFEEVNNYLDLDNYTHYIITQIYIANYSYKHNIKTWRQNTIADGFKWLIFDTDRGYMHSWKEVFMDIYENDTVFKRLLDNIQYRNHFLQQTCSHINASFRKGVVDHLLDSLKSQIETEMPLHIERWAPHGGVSSMGYWEEQIQKIRDFALQRKDTLLLRLNTFFDLDGQVSIELKKSHLHGGDIYIENVLIPYNDSLHTYFKNIPVTLVVKPNPGYVFVDWEGISTSDSITMTFSEDLTLHARFEPDCEVPSVINEDFAFVESCSPYYIDSDIMVDTGAILYSEPGVQILFADHTKLLVKGELNLSGSSENPIEMGGQNENGWKYIESDGGTIKMDQVHIYSGEKALYVHNQSTLKISNCIFTESDLDVNDLISATDSDVEIIDCVFNGNPQNTKRDGIDCDQIYSGIFSGNTFYDISDDCIDIGTNSTNIVIDHNEMYHCQSMGVSIGESSVGTIFRNIIVHCEGGIQVHSEAVAQVINNTLFANNAGVRAFHYDNTPLSGGTAHIVNTIFSQCVSDITLQSNSEVSIKYSLSDKQLHGGEGNLFQDPRFISPDENNFELQESSPCIDTGDPLSLPDPDGSRADIGAIPYGTHSSVYEESGVLRLYPNPASESLTIELLSGDKIDNFRIYNLSGDCVQMKENIQLRKMNIKLDHKGILVLIVQDQKGIQYNQKILSR
ncbi:MAG: CotH kinase family protein [Bacteroidetes bacterium]|nr:CotH kinase family protein [Bacteroidota bacterium]